MTTNPDGNSLTNEYYSTGELKKTHGARAYPVEYKYDAQGRMTNMTTWQSFSGDNGKAHTSWRHDASRGFMVEKRYHGSTI